MRTWKSRQKLAGGLDYKGVKELLSEVVLQYMWSSPMLENGVGKSVSACPWIRYFYQIHVPGVHSGLPEIKQKPL